MKDFAMKAPPKASVANKALNIRIVGKLRGAIPAQFSTGFYFGTFG